MAQKTRAKYGYLSCDDILVRINNGQLDAYDVVFTKDTHETYVISPDLVPICIKSRVYVFNSVSEAENILSKNTDTYTGQIVSILNGEMYNGYIVNVVDGKVKVVPLYEYPEPIDYNTFGNKPIVNLIGTLDTPVFIASLDSGVYSIKGHYKITESDITAYLNPNINLFIVEKTDEQILIKKISNNEIIDYTVINEEVTKTNLTVTEEFLKERGYTTTTYVDDKIATLDVITREDAEAYITSILEEKLDDILDEKINEMIDAKIQGASDDQIMSLFYN